MSQPPSRGLSYHPASTFREGGAPARINPTMVGPASEVRRRYEQRYVPGQALYLSEVQPEDRASVVIDNNDPAHPITTYAVQHGTAADGASPRH